MKFDEKKFAESIQYIKDSFQNMDEADGQALVDVLDNLAGIICPENLKDIFTEEEIAKKYNFKTLKRRIYILSDKKLDETRRTMISCACASLAFPIAIPERHTVTVHFPKKPKTF